MKKICYLGLIIFFSACNQQEEKEPAPLPEQPPEATTDSLQIVKGEAKLYVWKNDADYTRRKNSEINVASVNADSLIKGLNQMYENVYLQKDKQSNDTLYTFIKDSEFLTNRMGSTGAEVYVADVVMNLTEVPGIKYVHIDLQEGSHMQPGTWSRTNFARYKVVE
jgi:hypothetical protein